ncbi:manganese efflux pump [Thalassorhabdus alkalitolerans]|uniref:Manganese efflux pump n=1 Tax=Thalassorhabdus alkalitolerans TaxID=2282697 RepID=A0ABW0YKY0_9BACI
MALLSIIMLAIAVSLDNLTVGTAYGIRKLHIPPYFLGAIGLMAFGACLIAGIFGEGLRMLLPDRGVSMLSGLLFIVIGLFSLRDIYRSHATEHTKGESEAPEHQLSDWKEGLFLAFALSLDALGAGITAAIFEYSLLLTSAVVAVCSVLFFVLGEKAGFFLIRIKWMKRLSFLPGILLIGLGVYQFVS